MLSMQFAFMPAVVPELTFWKDISFGSSLLKNKKIIWQVYAQIVLKFTSDGLLMRLISDSHFFNQCNFVAKQFIYNIYLFSHRNIGALTIARQNLKQFNHKITPLWNLKSVGPISSLILMSCPVHVIHCPLLFGAIFFHLSFSQPQVEQCDRAAEMFHPHCQALQPYTVGKVPGEMLRGIHQSINH